MEHWREAPADGRRSVVTIGVFDGVHRGHQRVISHTVELAEESDHRSVALSFEPHPMEVIRPGSHPPILTPTGRKAELIELLGVDALWVMPFTEPFSRLTPELFVRQVLVDGLSASAVVVGENFRFGHKAAGDVAALTEMGREYGFTVRSAPLAAGAAVYSSSLIRDHVAAGDVVAAAEALGRAHRVEGIVVRGDQRGREIGFPTANLELALYTAVPADGVYAGWAIGDKVQRPVAISIGTNPTFNGEGRRVEAYLLDFDGDLYGERLSLDFKAHLRETVRYDGIEPLVAQITEDVAQTRRIVTAP